MIRKAFVMQVNPDAHEEYQRRHNPIWPELEAVLKSHGAHNYAIYLDKARNLLFAMVEIESEERWNAVASTDVCQRWWKYMTDVMPANRITARWWQAAKCFTCRNCPMCQRCLRHNILNFDLKN